MTSRYPVAAPRLWMTLILRLARCFARMLLNKNKRSAPFFFLGEARETKTRKTEEPQGCLIELSMGFSDIPLRTLKERYRVLFYSTTMCASKIIQ